MKHADILIQLELELAKLNATPMGRRIFLASIPYLMSSCATSKHRYREGSNKGQKTKITVKDEKKMADEYMSKMMKDYPLVEDSYLQKYVNYVGNRIVKTNKLEGRPYKYDFYLVQSSSVNAFALPAGKIFVTAPLLAMADSEAELAGVVGHEVGHVMARHAAERIDKMEKSKTQTALFGLGGAIVGGVLGDQVGKKVCNKKKSKNKKKRKKYEKEYQKCLDNARKLGAAAGAAGGLLIQKYKFMANSREDEMEADRIGFKTAVRAGYHKDYVGKFYNKLRIIEKQHKGSNSGVMKSLADAMSTHPSSGKRIQQMKSMAKKAKQSKNPVTNTSRFVKAKKTVHKIMGVKA